MLTKKFFSNNRKKFQSKLKPNSFAIFFSKDQIIKGDSEFFDFSDPNLFYLTGINQSKTKLIITNNKSYLFIQKTSKFLKTWEGEKLSKTQANKFSGINNLYYLEDFETIFSNLIQTSKNVYYYEEPKKFTNSISEYDQFIKKIKRKYKKNYVNSFDILKNQRQIKSNEEIKQVEKTMKITKIAFNDILKQLKTSNSEATIEAILTYNFTKNLAKHAYHPIVASGKNACILHYIKNNKKFKRNQLLLIDSGAELNNYKTDISRTFPISGKFTKRQKEVYQKVLEIQEFAIQLLKPNLSRIEWEKKIAYFVIEKLIELKLITQKQFNENKNILRKYYPHSTGHFLGLDTHDIGDYKKPFQEGEVYTVEPGIYIEKEEIGIRIEDNILITKKGAKILSNSIPKKINEIEF